MARSVPFVYFDDAAVERHLRWSPLVDGVRNCLADFSRRDDSVLQPVRTSFAIQQHQGWFGNMSAYTSREDVIVTKLITHYPGNTTCPRLQAVVVLHQPTDGTLQAVMCGDRITGMRTAAASVVATRLLARSCQVLAILGTGTQARAHAEAFISTTPELKEIRIWGRNSAKAAELTAALSAEHPGVTFRHFECARGCVDGANVVTTTTASPKPILFSEWIADGVHINAVGGTIPGKQELEPALFHRADVYTDSREGFSKEGPPDTAICGEIGQLVSGQLAARDDRQVTVFLSLGIAAEDVVAGRLIWDSYQKTEKQQ